MDPPRNLVAAGVLKGDLYIHGGDLPGGDPCCGSPFPQNVTNEFWRFDGKRGIWEEISGCAGAAPALKRHRAVEVGKDLFLFSGFDFTVAWVRIMRLHSGSFVREAGDRRWWRMGRPFRACG